MTQQKFAVVDAETFLLAIKESFDGQFDPEALEWLHLREKRIFDSLTNRAIFAAKRDRMLYYQGMLDGVMLQLRKMVLRKKTELQDMNLMLPDGTVKKEN